MSSEYIILHDSPHTETQAWEAAIETPTRKRTLALAKPESAFPDSGFLTPNAVKSLVEQQLQIYVQYGFGNHNPFSDADYADAGAEFTRHYADLSMLSNIVLKFDAFTLDQIALAKEKQTLFSMLSPEMFTPEYIEAVNERKITMIALDLMHGDDGIPAPDKIRRATLSEAGFQIALSNFVLPLAETLAHAPSLPYALQRAPELMQGILCHDGHICHQPTAERLHLPFRDILSLCWDLN